MFPTYNILGSPLSFRVNMDCIRYLVQSRFNSFFSFVSNFLGFCWNSSTTERRSGRSCWSGQVWRWLATRVSKHLMPVLQRNGAASGGIGGGDGTGNSTFREDGGRSGGGVGESAKRGNESGGEGREGKSGDGKGEVGRMVRGAGMGSAAGRNGSQLWRVPVNQRC